ncbi:MAG: DoxX family membrane protein [Deltaproteobacteria bacterium]|nr:MAG: DoxX family membrane protein [Deltaproteobacteria bacterium]
MDVISKWAQVVGRVALGTIFVVSGLGKLAAWRGTVAYAASKGVPEILLAIATALELLGAVSIVVATTSGQSLLRSSRWRWSTSSRTSASAAGY